MRKTKSEAKEKPEVHGKRTKKWKWNEEEKRWKKNKPRRIKKITWRKHERVRKERRNNQNIIKK